MIHELIASTNYFLKFSRNSEALASEFLENWKKCLFYKELCSDDTSPSDERLLKKIKWKEYLLVLVMMEVLLPLLIIGASPF